MSERETILDQAMKAFVAAHRAGTLASVATFIQNYPAEEHEAILNFIEEYLELEAELATMPVDPSALAAVDTARQRVQGQHLRHQGQCSNSDRIAHQGSEYGNLRHSRQPVGEGHGGARWRLGECRVKRLFNAGLQWWRWGVQSESYLGRCW